MPGYMVCPYCRATVKPLVGADGQKVCPVCNNRGTGAQPAPVGAAGPPNAPGAVASLVLGIVGIVVSWIGIVLGIIAIVMANKARAAIRAHPGAFGGEGLATAGRILGIIAIVIGSVGLIMAAVVFGLVSQLADQGRADVELSADEPGNSLLVLHAESGLDWGDFEVTGTAGCVLPTGSVDEGDVVQCAQDGSVRITYEPLDDEVYEGAV